MAKKENRVMVTMACTECKRRNYNTFKNKQNTTDRLELSKYCRFCRCHKRAPRNQVIGFASANPLGR